MRCTKSLPVATGQANTRNAVLRLYAKLLRVDLNHQPAVPNQLFKSHKRFIWRSLRDEKCYFLSFCCPVTCTEFGMKPGTPVFTTGFSLCLV